MTRDLAAFHDRLIARRDEFASYGALVPADKLLDRVIEELEDVLRGADEEPLTLEQAANESGYSADHLRKCVADGTVPNAGAKGRPRIRRADLPRKPGRSASGYDPGADAVRLERLRLESA
ncbi:MAG: hypothetical protein ACYCVL_10570 [Gemmatimonadaceae bacterium]